MNRDIKPDNVLYDDKDSRYLIADWGVAEIFHGKPYMSQ